MELIRHSSPSLSQWTSSVDWRKGGKLCGACWRCQLITPIIPYITLYIYMYKKQFPFHFPCSFPFDSPLLRGSLEYTASNCARSRSASEELQGWWADHEGLAKLGKWKRRWKLLQWRIKWKRKWKMKWKLGLLWAADVRLSHGEKQRARERDRERWT